MITILLILGFIIQVILALITGHGLLEMTKEIHDGTVDPARIYIFLVFLVQGVLIFLTGEAIALRMFHGI